MSASESVIRFGAGGRDALLREPLQRSTIDADTGNEGVSSSSQDAERERRTRAAKASALLSRAIGTVHLTLGERVPHRCYRRFSRFVLCGCWHGR